MIQRIFVEKKNDVKAALLKEDIKNLLKIDLDDLRIFSRYDIEGMDEGDFEKALGTVFFEPPVDELFRENIELPQGYDVFAVAPLAGQYDQRSDSAEQCVELLSARTDAEIACAQVYAVKGASAEELDRIKNYLVNPVECEITGNSKPETLKKEMPTAEPAATMKGFTSLSDKEIDTLRDSMSLAMSCDDLRFVRDYFKGEGRDPYETEIKVLDTYWSDHCRHTTFLTELESVEVEGNCKTIEKALKLYQDLFDELYAGREDKYRCLLDIATIGAKKLRKEGKIENLDESEEINSCSIKTVANLDGKDVDYTIMFKNETHNHPTEIEPFGGAATCLGGAIRDPLAGRTYVVQSMRITGSGDPTADILSTMPGKLPQRVITKTAASGFSSYGNQIGLATGQVDEIYHEGYKAKRLETGFVVGGAPTENIKRAKPEPGDVVILLGGKTGRDGCGGATGSSKAHDMSSVATCGAEVQKGNPLTERKIQRLFKRKDACNLIKRCNDFGAGGVAVAIGELSDGLDIDLNLVPKKYEGLSGTELAISESQERMAVVVAKEDADRFIALAAEENLDATVVARVTDSRRLQMTFNGEMIVDISRDFMNTNGVKQIADARICENVTDYFEPKYVKDFASVLRETLSDLNVCSKKGLGEMFDSTIGAKSVYMPYGGKNQLTPIVAMAAKLVGGETDDCTLSSYGFCTDLMCSSPFAGAVYSIVGSVSKIVAAGGDYRDVRLSLQEFFMKMTGDPERWGVPLSALLGALWAQMGLGLAAIGGKDSMSGSFEDLDVPPTLISFALAPAKASKLVTNVFEDGDRVYLLRMKRDDEALPDFEILKQMYACVHENILTGNVVRATVTENGGAVSAVVKSALGNGLGFDFACDDETAFSGGYGDIIVSANDIEKLAAFDPVFLGTAKAKHAFTSGDESLSYEDALAAYCGRLESVFSAATKVTGEVPDCDFAEKAASVNVTKSKIARPKVFMPVFPGTNCEYDMERAFSLAGADVETLVVKNRSARDIEESAKALAAAIKGANILALPGGFSAGDEPDGSGKFIATAFKNRAVSDAVSELLRKDGLVLGICNGFQALIKLGLLPYGKIQDLAESSPTLTFNDISRHVSTLVSVRVSSTLSPWLSACKVGDVYRVPISHGEGKVVAPKEELERMRAAGQIATQYCDELGNPTMSSPFNPNGSMYAIEGICSQDGKIFGKMGHCERWGEGLYKNCEGNFDMKLFSSGVGYFK